MDRRDFIAGSGTLALAGLALDSAAAAPKTVALLWVSSEGTERQIGYLRDGLRAAGFPEPAAIRLDTTSLVDRYEALDEAARRVMQRRPDVVITFGATSLTALRAASSTIPVVMLIGSDPVKQGYVASFARPGGNVTGIWLVSTDSGGKRLELLQRIKPGVKRVAYFYNDRSPAEVNAAPGVVASAKSLGFMLEPMAIRLPGDIHEAVAKAARSGVDAMYLASSTMFIANARRFVEAVNKTRVPVMYPNAEFTDAGGLISYGPNMPGALRLAADYTARILRGSRPGEMPVEQYEKFELVVNMRAARAQGIVMPQSVLGLADRVVDA